MGLMTPAQYVESLRDGRVTYWDGERIDDITPIRSFKRADRGRLGDYDYARSHPAPR
jgi:4-hydroxybutyryl-CoA dehydratase/vinylacetyl-CoA-Delta-isomerase